MSNQKEENEDASKFIDADIRKLKYYGSTHQGMQNL